MRNSNLAETIETTDSAHRPVLTALDGGRLDNVMDPLEEISFKKTKRQHIREFGGIMALVLVMIAGYKLYYSGNLNTILTLSACSAVFALACIWTPRLMLPVLKAWMFIGHYLEIVMTRVILGLMWFATFFPIGILFKLIGKNTVTLGYEPNRPSYWEDCDASRHDFRLLERQY